MTWEVWLMTRLEGVGDYKQVAISPPW
jgi:hypothetical protein